MNDRQWTQRPAVHAGYADMRMSRSTIPGRHNPIDPDFRRNQDAPVVAEISNVSLCYMQKTPSPIIDICKYGGKQVAIVDGKIVAIGTDTQTLTAEVLRQ